MAPFILFNFALFLVLTEIRAFSSPPSSQPEMNVS
jgi:hypothetical protein